MKIPLPLALCLLASVLPVRAADPIALSPEIAKQALADAKANVAKYAPGAPEENANLETFWQTMLENDTWTWANRIIKDCKITDAAGNPVSESQIMAVDLFKFDQNGVIYGIQFTDLMVGSIPRDPVLGRVRADLWALGWLPLDPDKKLEYNAVNSRIPPTSHGGGFLSKLAGVGAVLGGIDPTAFCGPFSAAAGLRAMANTNRRRP